jgi:hypothetical protein
MFSSFLCSFTFYHCFFILFSPPFLFTLSATFFSFLSHHFDWFTSGLALFMSESTENCILTIFKGLECNSFRLPISAVFDYYWKAFLDEYVLSFRRLSWGDLQFFNVSTQSFKFWKRSILSCICEIWKYGVFCMGDELANGCGVFLLWDFAWRVCFDFEYCFWGSK